MAAEVHTFELEIEHGPRHLRRQELLRTARHASESPVFLTTRILAFADHCERGLNFAPGGLSDTKQPALYAEAPGGGYALWIEIGLPDMERLERALKRSNEVWVYPHREPGPWRERALALRVPRKHQLELVEFELAGLERLAQHIERRMHWRLHFEKDSLKVGGTGFSIEIPIQRALSIGRG